MFEVNIKSRIGKDISILIRQDNHPWNYICDCGTAEELNIKEIQKTKAIFISHTHIDHFINFDTILRHQIGINRTVIIVGPKNIAQQLQSKILAYTWNLIGNNEICYEVRELISEDEHETYELRPPLWKLQKINTKKNKRICFQQTSFKVQYTILDHKIPSIAYRFTESDKVKLLSENLEHHPGPWINQLKKAFLKNLPESIITIDQKEYLASDFFHLLKLERGDSLGIILDHAASPENHSKIKQDFLDCNQVLIESFYTDEDKELANKNFHSYASMSGKIMYQANVKNAIPIHFSRKYKKEELILLKSQFDNTYKNVK